MTDGVFAVRVRLFGQPREEAGASTLDVELEDGATVGDLRAALAGHPTLGAHIDLTAVAINHRYASDEEHVAQGDEVALIPPVAGG